MKPQSTVEKILNAAEEEFAQRGFNGVTVRDVVRKAGVNLAAVNYHFGNLEGLYVEVVRRRIRPLNLQRLSLLDAAVARCPSGLPALAEIVEILVRPVFEVHCDPERGGPNFVQIMARGLWEPLPFQQNLQVSEYYPTITRFSQLIRRHVPHLSPEDFMWRLSFVIGAMQHTLGTLHQMHALTRGICADNDCDGALRRFIEFSIAVFTAPARPATKGG